MKNRKPGVFKVLKKNMKPLVQFEIFYKLLFLLVFVPLISGMIQLSLNLTKFRYITKENFSKYLTNPITIIMLLLLFIFIAFFTLVDVGAIIYNTDQSYQGNKTNMLEMVKFGLKNACKVLYPKNILLSLFMVLILPFMSIGVAYSYFRMTSISDIILASIRVNWKIMIVITCVILLMLFIFSRFIFSFHYFTLDGYSFKESCKKSSQLSKKRRISTVLKILWMQIILGIIFAVLLLIGTGIALIVTKVIATGKLLESIFLSIVIVYMNALYVLFLSLLTPFSFICISILFYREREKISDVIPHSKRILYTEKKILKKIERITETVILLSAILVSSIYVYLLETGEIDFKIEYVQNVEVTAHRGASAYYPENSMSAFYGAVQMGADWIELDVQQTKDGQIIVMHDTNLYRTTGIRKNIWETTYAEIQDMEIGSWFGEDYTGEAIPLLSEVLELAKENHVKLNIELKPTGHERNFEKNVVDLVREYDYVDECVVTSQVYEVLENIKAYDEGIHTVYVMSVAYGNILRLKAADGFSIKYTFITDSLVSRVHNAGKEIFAWTVNSEYQIDQCLSLGVDNVITDDILLAKKCIYAGKTSNVLLRYLQKILGFPIKQVQNSKHFFQV